MTPQVQVPIKHLSENTNEPEPDSDIDDTNNFLLSATVSLTDECK